MAVNRIFSQTGGTLEHLYSTTLRDAPPPLPSILEGPAFAETRAALIRRLTAGRHPRVRPPEDPSAAHLAMLARIEKSELSPMFAAELDDYMNPAVQPRTANHT